MADRQVKVTLSAQVQQYIDGMEKASRATRDTGSEAEKLAQKSQAFEQMGRASMVAGGAMAAGLALSAKAAIDWDSAWAGVLKTVDGTPQQLDAVEEGLRGLTSVLPASHTEIAAVAEAAGQLGVQTDNVVAFTRTMIDLGETTNLTSEEAATSLARFTNIMGTSQSEVSNLGAALVDLGNNYATTEREILEMSMRLAGAGAQIGMSEGEVLGLSTALSSVGIAAEAGGSAMSKVMIDIAASVEEGGSRVGEFAKIAGVSVKEFSDLWRNDAGNALALFVKGLADAESQGTSTLGMIDELGIKEVRMRDALLRSASAADQFSDAMAQGNQAFHENTALTDEAEKRYETTAAKLGIMRNQVVDAAISLGEHLLPAIETVAGGIGGFADMLSGLDGPMGAVVAWGGVIASGILLTGGLALSAVPKIAAYKVALETLGITSAGVRGKLGGFVRFLGGPWGAAMIAAGLTVGAFNKALEGSVASSQEFENSIKQGVGALDVMADKAAQNETGLTGFLVDVSQHFDNLPALMDKAATAGRGFWSSMSFNENAALDAVREFGDALSSLAAKDMPRAQQEFARFVKDAGLNEAQAITALNEEMASFKGQLIDSAEAAGLATDDVSLLKYAMGELKPVTDAAADAAEENADALARLEGKAEATKDELDALADAIRGFASAELDARAAARNLEQAYDDLTKSVKDNGLSLDITTDKGRANESAIDAVAKAALDAAAATLEQTYSQEEANKVLSDGRDRLIDMLGQFDITGQAAEDYADNLGLIPENIDTFVELTGVNEAEEALETLTRTRTSLVEIIYAEGAAPAREWHAPMAIPPSANGNLFEFANGGGLETGIYAGGPPITRFAEPETQWEAFISGKPSERDRNRQIWQETGQRLGMDTVGKSVVHVPTHVTVQDADGRLIGTMAVVANEAIDDFVTESSSVARRA